MTTGSASATSDDKLWAALAYVFTPVVPIILLLLEDKKNRPFIKQHNMQALVAGIIVYFVLVPIIVTVTIGCGTIFVPVLWVLFLYWAYQAYQGKSVNIPVITDLVKNQGWA